MDRKEWLSEEKLDVPAKFLFPFVPYTIQQDFMIHLYSALEEGKLGIFESPTGTGKSLSMICGAFRWLLDHEERKRRQLMSAISALDEEIKAADTDSAGDWITQQAAQVALIQRRQEFELQLRRITCHDVKMEQLKKKLDKRRGREHHHKKQSVKPKEETIQESKDDSEDCDILLEDCTIDGEEETESDGEQKEDVEEYHSTQLYFCSRTHSQLTQFVGEVQRSPYGEQIRLVSLASRQSYCINAVVQKLRSISLINERCLDMQRKKQGRATNKDTRGEVVKKSRGCAGCTYLQSQAVEVLQDETLMRVHDVDQLVTRGRELSACPYYASRSAVKDAQVVVVPYNTLLHKATRDACGIKVAGNVVIIDEAHNLLDTIGHIHSAEVFGHQLTHAYSQLVQYRDRYESRFSAANLLHLNQIIFIVKKLIWMLGGKPDGTPVEATRMVVNTKLFTLADFVLTAEIFNFNLFTLLEFCRKSRIVHKLHGFAERYHPSVSVNTITKSTGLQNFLKEISADKNGGANDKQVGEGAGVSESLGNNPFMPVLSFLECLTNHCDDGRVVCSRQLTVGSGRLKFLLLNPASHFSSIVKEARAVIVAGGTMQPLEEFRDQLFLSAGGDPARLMQFSCGHIIPLENILPIALSSGPSNKPLDFSFQSRSSLAMLNEIGRILLNVCNVVPAGIVCFFPSYEYEKVVFAHLEKSGTLEKIEAKKKVFREPKRAGLMEKVLSNFAACMDPSHSNLELGPTGALLLSVVGGKLSEGLNFSDDLGRCVLVVGMPYPNICSPELQEKITYFNTHGDSKAGQKYYENLCMKAVNQSIGRAVRHKGDYSSVLLLDQRYAHPHTQLALPAWIQKSLQTHGKFGSAMSQLCKFFATRKK